MISSGRTWWRWCKRREGLGEGFKEPRGRGFTGIETSSFLPSPHKKPADERAAGDSLPPPLTLFTYFGIGRSEIRGYPMKIEIAREDDGRWIAEIPELPGVMAYGHSRKEAISKAEALALRVLADRLEHGEEIPQLKEVFAITA